MYTDPYGPTEDGWVAVYKCTRNGHLAHMEVFWDGPTDDSVDINVYEFPSTEPEHEKAESKIKITVPLDEAQQKVNETGETWIKALDNN